MSGRARFAGAGVLVTGSSRGLGRDIALAFGAEGAHVAVCYRARSDEAAETLDGIVEAGGSGSLLAMDIRDRESVKAAVSAAEKERSIEVLVNNAAIVQDQPFVMMSPAEWNETLETNLTGTYHCCRAVLPAMMARGRGAIVNVASIAAFRASPGQASYAASKGGVLSLTLTLAREVAPRGVRVNAVVPGLLQTGMGARLDRRVVERRLENIPLARLGRGEEAARAVLFLASDEASYIVGQTLTVDGGLSL
jgi:3-oxoacyl-[acyl-carrier protein] reductase